MTNLVVATFSFSCRHVIKIKSWKMEKSNRIYIHLLSILHFCIVSNKCTSVIYKHHNMNRAYLHVIVINLQHIKIFHSTYLLFFSLANFPWPFKRRSTRGRFYFLPRVLRSFLCIKEGVEVINVKYLSTHTLTHLP